MNLTMGYVEWIATLVALILCFCIWKGRSGFGWFRSKNTSDIELGIQLDPSRAKDD